MKRRSDIDTMKGIGIVLMICGHTGLTSFLGIESYINAFYMPMFFLISGFFFKPEKYSIPSYIKKKTKSLLIPYAVFSILYLALWLLVNAGGVSLEGEKSEIIRGVVWDNNCHYPIGGAMWFVSCLFFVEIISCIMIKKLSNISVVGITVAICLTGIFTHIFLPWSLDSGMVAIMFYIIGYELHLVINDKESFVGKKYLLYIFALMSICLFILATNVNGFCNLRTCTYGHYPLLFIVSSITGSYICYLISNVIANTLSKIGEIISYIGKNSMVFVCFNQLIIAVVKRIIFFDNVSYLVVVTLFVVFVCMIIVKLLSILRLNWIVGI